MLIIISFSARADHPTRGPEKIVSSEPTPITVILKLKRTEPPTAPQNKSIHFFSYPIDAT